MADKISSETKQKLEKSLKAFVNLLKEFPKDASADFIYDESTIKKILQAEISMDQLNQQREKIIAVTVEEDREALLKAIKNMGKLIEELPKDPADEFMYDRTLHLMVEEARETIVKLYNLVT